MWLEGMVPPVARREAVAHWLQDRCLKETVFMSLRQTRAFLAAWWEDYDRVW